MTTMVVARLGERRLTWWRVEEGEGSSGGRWYGGCGKGKR